MRLVGIALAVLGLLGLAWSTWHLPGNPPKYLHRNEVGRFRRSAQRTSLGLFVVGGLLGGLG